MNRGLFKIGKIFGVPVFLHWTFLLFLGWIVVSELMQGGDAIAELLFVVAIFGCVLLHELGHAMMARKFRIKTRDITLYPIGGVASILGATTPIAEFWIAIAGPLVNVVIMFAIAPLTDFVRFLGISSEQLLFSSFTFWEQIFWINLMLVVFNMIPAYPMDGGRVLRALLSMGMGETRGSILASRIGQVLSILMLGWALYSSQVILTIIALMVFSHASQELFIQRSKVAAGGRLVRESMLDLDKLQTLQHGMTIGRAADVSLKSLQNDFPVMLGSDVLGVITREAIFEAVAAGEKDSYLSGYMSREFPRAAPSDELLNHVERLTTGRHLPLMVFEGDRFLGMVPSETLYELLVVSGLPGFSKSSVKPNVA